ncbi:cytochrome c [Spirulina sp. CCNP1310]|uniref:cytochrome c n=1 Tax=Spirulina sp. CCNP1310 TaxID=3110249 RepID=UPI002B1EA01E|nr:cytochrome c [Spirulina sp. CCNP1310]MEA5417668.1 cytochrome c [Spirulina sp. CCNP1310]
MTNPPPPPLDFSPQLRFILFLLVAIALLGAGFYFFSDSDPYIQAVLALEGQGDGFTNADRGHAIFEINCAGCHGVYATGNVGPSLENLSRHKSDAMIIHQVISGDTPPMPKFQPNPQDMADLLRYLKRL